MQKKSCMSSKRLALEAAWYPVWIRIYGKDCEPKGDCAENKVDNVLSVNAAWSCPHSHHKQYTRCKNFLYCPVVFLSATCKNQIL